MRNFGHAQKFAQLEGGLLPEETVGRQTSHNEPSRHAEQRTNIAHSPAPCLRIPLQVSTTTSAGKEAKCGAGNTTSSVPANFCACPEVLLSEVLLLLPRRRRTVLLSRAWIPVQKAGDDPNVLQGVTRLRVDNAPIARLVATVRYWTAQCNEAWEQQKSQPRATSFIACSNGRTPRSRATVRATASLSPSSRSPTDIDKRAAPSGHRSPFLPDEA